MIEPHSLRKGNWVEHNDKKRIIEEIGKYGIDLYGDFDGEVYAEVPFEELEGIDLSPELLMDFGFEELPGHIEETVPPELQDKLGSMPLLHYNYEKSIIKDDQKYTLSCISTVGWFFQGKKLPVDPASFHELQNLHYFLMGEELNLPKYE